MIINADEYKTLREYGISFFNKLLKDLNEEDANLTPPIIYLKWDNTDIIQGYYDGTNSISIINSDTLTEYEIKETIRHETIHYTLTKLGIPSNDWDTEFMNIAKSYNCYPQEYLKEYFNK